ncbi:EF-hand domain-containing protein [Planctomycetales bacterium ZRK34]|nr:EF-hand domain-containing protein [Planctomycetales bacterium ZRK34]
MNRRIMGCLLTTITLSMLAACSNNEPAASQPAAEPAAVVEPAVEQSAPAEAPKAKKPLSEFQQADLDGDGTLEYDEFAGTPLAQQASDPDGLFKELDKDGDEELSRKEFKAGLKQASQ